MIVIGIAGGTGSGKTTVVKKILSFFSKTEVAVLSQDSYYKDNRHLPEEEREKLNFDHPDSIEFELLVEHLLQLKQGKPIEEPHYSYLTCTRADETTTVWPKSVVLVEGILVLCSPELRKMMDIKVFVDCDSDVRLSRVIQRDSYNFV